MSDSLKLTKEAIEEAAEVAKAIMPAGDGNPIPTGEQKNGSHYLNLLNLMNYLLKIFGFQIAANVAP